jgi:protein O-GlcNAcase/histone acetyltransferase
MTAERSDGDFLSGAIEGFYGEPWSDDERLELFGWLRAWDLNTYVYAPKDDLHHRTIWREPYPADDAARIGSLVASCRAANVRFVYALAPGLDVRYGDRSELHALHARVDQLQRIGCRDFALLFDDIPETLDAVALGDADSLAAAQSRLANALFARAGEGSSPGRFLFCPTPYCGRMAEAAVGGPGYLETIGRELGAGVDIFWTGPDIVSRDIRPAEVRDVAGLLRRKPVIWDNLHANDYDGRRRYCGPYAGRPPELKHEVAGVLSNPNNELPLDFVPLRTLAAYLAGPGPWDPRRAYLEALAEWHASFATVGAPLSLEDLALLGDCFYLPYEDGPGAWALYESARALLSRPPAEWGDEVDRFLDASARLRRACARLTGLRDRRLFHALSRPVWDLREELDLLERYVAAQSRASRHHRPVESPFHRPGTFRGGFTARLQQLLAARSDGTFVAAGAQEEGTPDDGNALPGTRATVR